MRAIKCRGRIIGRGEWIYGYYVDGYMFDEKKGCITVPFIVSQQMNSYERVEGETVGQFTELKDKNGREIYEGDVLSDGKMLYLVKYSFTETGMVAQKIGETGIWSLYHLSIRNNKGREIEVVGNMHDNPELVTA